MKRNKLCICFTLLMAVCVVFLSACSLFSTEDSISYKDTEGGKALYRYDGNSTHDTFIIPPETEGVPVVELMDFSVAASETLEYLTIGKNVKLISGRAFCGSNKIVAFSVEEGNQYFETEDGVLYTKGKTELVCYPNARKNVDGTPNTVITIPDSVTVIRQCAFYNCSAVTEVIFGSGVTKVENNAFMKCTSLTSLTLNEGLTEIGTDGFSFCDSLTQLTLPSTLAKVGEYGFFSQASKLESFVTKRPLEQIECGSNWLPTKNGLKTGEIKPVFEA